MELPREPKQNLPSATTTAKPKNRKLTNQQLFLNAYEECYCVKSAAKTAGVVRRTHYHWLQHDPDYASQFKESQEIASDFLESVAVERATHGWSEAIYFRGKRCGSVRRYSDGLLQFLLRGAKPTKYGITRREITGPQGAPVQGKIEVVFVRPPPYDDDDDAPPDPAPGGASS
jgi:hypothetical protein